MFQQSFRSGLRKNVLKICSKFTGEHPRQSVIGCLCSSTLGPQNIARLNTILLFNFEVVITLTSYRGMLPSGNKLESS